MKLFLTTFLLLMIFLGIPLSVFKGLESGLVLDGIKAITISIPVIAFLAVLIAGGTGE
jgi:hypothetical protein